MDVTEGSGRGHPRKACVEELLLACCSIVTSNKVKRPKYKTSDVGCPGVKQKGWKTKIPNYFWFLKLSPVQMQFFNFPFVMKQMSLAAKNKLCRYKN